MRLPPSGSPGTSRSWKSCRDTSTSPAPARGSVRSERTLVAGVAYHQKMLEAIEMVAAERRSQR